MEASNYPDSYTTPVWHGSVQGCSRCCGDPRWPTSFCGHWPSCFKMGNLVHCYLGPPQNEPCRNPYQIRPEAKNAWIPGHNTHAGVGHGESDLNATWFQRTLCETKVR